MPTGSEKNGERCAQPISLEDWDEDELVEPVAKIPTPKRVEGALRKPTSLGNPNASLEERKLDELLNLAAEMEIINRTRMKKTDLIAAIRDKRKEI